MDTTFNPTRNHIADSAWQNEDDAGRGSGWLRQLASHFRYPEISPTDIRVAEYLPPAEWGPGKR